MPGLPNRSLRCALLFILAAPICISQSRDPDQSLEMAQYSVVVEAGNPPQVKLERDHQLLFQFPVVAGLASDTAQEHLSDIAYSLQKTAAGVYELTATAKSTLWTGRRFQWRFFPDHVEFQHFANGHGRLGRCYFLSNGVSNRWDNGTTDGRQWATAIYADRYFAPNPNLADQFEFNIAMPQILGFSVGRGEGSDEDFRPERMTGIFAPPPLFLAFHLDKTWTGIGIGAKPGVYRSSLLLARWTRSRATRRGSTKTDSTPNWPRETFTGTTCPSFADGLSKPSNLSPTAENPMRSRHRPITRSGSPSSINESCR